MYFTKYFTNENDRLNHCGTVKLETERLILNRITTDMAEQMYKNFAGDERVSRYMSWEFHSVDEVSEWLNDWQSEYKKSDTYYWGLYLKDTNELIGTIYLISEGEIAKVGSISYCIGYQWWGNGYMQEALKSVISFAFEQVSYNRIEAFHAKSNLQSARVMQKAGMTLDGTLRQRAKTFIGYEDCVFYSILKNEYLESKTTFKSLNDNAYNYEILLSLMLPYNRELDEHNDRSTTEDVIVSVTKSMLRLQSKPERWLEICFVGNNPIGFYQCKIDRSDDRGYKKIGYGYIMEFYIKPEYRLKGYGKAMLERIEAHFSQRGVSNIYLTADAVTGEPFWTKMGFTFNGETSPENNLKIYEKEIWI